MVSRKDEAAERKRCGQYNCAQSVACTYADIAGVDDNVIGAATSAFGTGMGTMTGTCGALVGAGVVLGMVINDRVAARAAMKRVMVGFEKWSHSVPRTERYWQRKAVAQLRWMCCRCGGAA